MEDQNSKIGHYCGIAGIYSKSAVNIPEKLFYILFSLQHRGQESAGISFNKNGEIKTYKDLGMVPAVLSRYLHLERSSHVGIGHVRYSTKDGNKIENVQPIHVVCNKGHIALAHNGALTNAAELKDKVFTDGAIVQSTTDTEIILHVLSRVKENDPKKAILSTLQMIKGAYSLVMVKDDSLIAIRDPFGFRPLYMGKKDDMVIFASETCGLDIVQATDVREVAPGEMIIVDKNGIKSEFFAKSEQLGQCIFELIYFARPDSSVFGKSVYQMRKKVGAALADVDAASEEGFPGDIVVAVPDSGNYAALGYAERSGLPFEYGLSRNHYAGRSFIMPTKEERELVVRMKLNPIKDAVKGKNIILVDDSLVRGTTSKIIVKMLKEAGAKKIHLRLSSPEVKCPCYFGIDIPTTEELISNRMTPDEIAVHSGADSVKFLPIKELKNCMDNPNNFCYACFTGDYLTEIPKTPGECQ